MVVLVGFTWFLRLFHDLVFEDNFIIDITKTWTVTRLLVVREMILDDFKGILVEKTVDYEGNVRKDVLRLFKPTWMPFQTYCCYVRRDG